jgi:hypothetical protein
MPKLPTGSAYGASPQVVNLPLWTGLTMETLLSGLCKERLTSQSSERAIAPWIAAASVANGLFYHDLCRFA